MPRIFIQPNMISGENVVLQEQDAKRLMRVLRLTPGDSVVLFDGVREYLSEVVSLGMKSATLRITGSQRKDTEPPIEITLGQGLPKGEKLELVFQKAVELGVSRMVPVLMERSVKRPDLSDTDGRINRIRRIAIEAAQQSGRITVPEVPSYMDLPAFLAYTAKSELKLVFYEEEKHTALRPLLQAFSPLKSVSVLIGPEGGLTREEAALAEEAGYIIVGLGPRTLRTETAGIAAVAILQYELGDLS